MSEGGKPARNFAPRTIWTGDNLDILRGLNSETVDLIYLDPPYNSNRTYSAPIGSKTAGAAFEDTWTLDKEDVAWMGLIADQHPALHSVITAPRCVARIPPPNQIFHRVMGLPLRLHLY